MRSTGKLHLGHYHGVLKNWVALQHQHECFFFVADWHALTTHYDNPQVIADSALAMVVDWLATGIDPAAAHIFLQSRVPEHAELHLLLSMIAPLSWLERIPTFKDQQQQIKEKDLATYGFLGYPLLQSADVLIYKAHYVPVGEDQVSHIEFTREIARRFNCLYGREADFVQKADAAILKLDKKNAKLYREFHTRYQQQGDKAALLTGQALIEAQTQLSLSDKERLLGYLEGGGKIILPEPQPLLTAVAKLPGLDGRKMSKSYHNVINLREAPQVIEEKIRTMPTDPARVRRTDAGEPEKCPVWPLHQVYSTQDTKDWVVQGCRSAGIGCLDCKKPLIKAVQDEQLSWIENAKPYERDPDLVRDIIASGCEAARAVARETLNEVNAAMKLDYL
jgi:tryptophanyl-tRNA synthetase